MSAKTTPTKAALPPLEWQHIEPIDRRRIVRRPEPPPPAMEVRELPASVAAQAWAAANANRRLGVA
jgi:hypothetical protein